MNGSEGGGTPAVGRRRRIGDGRIPMWFGIPFLAFGILSIVIGYAALRQEQRLGEEGVVVDASVVRLWTETDDDSTTYHLRYVFVDPNTGLEHGGSSGNVGPVRYAQLELGDEVTVTYIPSEPATHRLGTPEPQLAAPVAFLGAGALFGVVGPIMLVVAFRQRRVASAGSPPVADPGPRLDVAAGDRARVDSFSRSPVRVVAEMILAPIGGLAMFGVAAWSLGQIGMNPDFLVVALVTAIFAVVLVVSWILALPRGFGTRLVEIGPDGIWLRGLGRLAWAEVAEVRLEESAPLRRRGAARRILVAADGREIASASRAGWYTRLGVLPRDPDLASRGGFARAINAGFVGISTMLRPDRPLETRPEAAPFGVLSYELEQPMGALVASVRRFASVADARAAEPVTEPALDGPPEGPAGPAQAMPAATAVDGPTTDLPLSDAAIRALDAGLSRPAAAAAAETAAPVAIAPLATAPPSTLVESLGPSFVEARQPRRQGRPAARVFRRRGFSTGDALSIVLPGREASLPPTAQVAVQAIVGVAFMVVPALMALGALGSAMRDGADGGVVLGLGFIVVVMFAMGFFLFRGSRRQWRTVSVGPDRLTVGPDGLAVGAGAPLAWGQIASVTSDEGTLEIQPVAGAGEVMTLPLDLFEDDRDEILDTIARYRIVDEE